MCNDALVHILVPYCFENSVAIGLLLPARRRSFGIKESLGILQAQVKY